MEAELHAIVSLLLCILEQQVTPGLQIRSGQPLTDAHFQSFIYQTLCGLKYIHSANILPQTWQSLGQRRLRTEDSRF